MKRDAFLDQVEIRHAHLFCGLGCGRWRSR